MSRDDPKVKIKLHRLSKFINPMDLHLKLNKAHYSTVRIIIISSINISLSTGPIKVRIKTK